MVVGVWKKVSSGRFSSLRKQSLVRRATLDGCKECGLSKGEWWVVEDVVSILRYPRTSKRTRRIW